MAESELAAAGPFRAYDVEVVADQFARKINALCVWGRQLLAGVGDGSLLFFEEPPPRPAEEASGGGSGGGGGGSGAPAGPAPPWQVTRLEKGFCKKPILQLEVVLEGEPAGPALICLTDDGAALHALPDLKPICSASRSARSTAFSWNPARRELALAARKKVVTHRLVTGDAAGDAGDARDAVKGAAGLQELTEFAVADGADRVAWVGGNIVVGTKRGYFLIVPAPPQSVEVLPGQVVQIYPTVTPQPLFPLGCAPHPVLAPLLPDPEPNGGGGDAGGGNGEGRRGAGAPAELLLCKDSASFFIQADGKASRKSQLQWGESPVALVAGDGYAVALLPGRVEVKSISRISTPAAVQNILLPGMAVVAPHPSPHDGSLFVASAAAGGGVRRLRPVPIERQARLLAGGGEFSGALELCARLPAPRRRQLEDALRLRFCRHLFEAGDVDDALTQLSMCSDAGPLLLLRLFPGLVPAKFRPLLPDEAYGEKLPDLDADEDAAAAAAGDGAPRRDAAGSVDASGTTGAHTHAHGHAGPAGREAAAVGVVVPYLLSYRTRLLAAMEEAAAASAAAAAAAAAEQDGGGGGGEGAAGRQQQQQQRKPAKPKRPIRRPGQPAGDAAAAAGATQQGPALHAGGASRPPEPPPAGAAAGAPEPAGSDDGAPPPPEVVATVLDTALLLAMLAQPDTGAALRLLQQRNFVDAAEGERALAAAGRYAELAALLQYTGQHAKGLELLRRLSQEPASLPVKPAGAAADLPGLPGVWAAVRYLTNLTPPNLALAEAHAGWLLRADPEAGLEAFLQMRPPLPAAAVLPILQRHAPDYCVVYLESALELGVASPGDFHSLLLTQYLAMALEEEEGGGDSAARHARKLSLSDSLLAKTRHPLEKLFPDGGPHAAAAAAAAHVAGGKAAGGEAEGGAAEGADSRRDAYDRLKELVYSSPHIDPEVVLVQLPTGKLPEIRALMLERLGRHREALSLYCHGIRSLPMAEAYCDRVYAAALAAQKASRAASGGGGGGGGGAPLSPRHRRVGSGGGGGMLAAAAAAAAATRPANPQPLLLKRTASGFNAAAAAAAAAAAPPRPPSPARRAAGLPLSMPALPSFLGPPSDIYIELLEALMEGPPGLGSAPPDSKRQRQQQGPSPAAARAPVDLAAWGELGAILSRKAPRIDTSKVLGMLPDDLPLECLSPLLCAMLQHATERSRNLSVVRSLRRGENLAAREDQVRAKQRSVVLTSDRACCMCHKRIGGSVLVAHPGGALAHYLCYKRAGEAEGAAGRGGGGAVVTNGGGVWAVAGL